MYKNQLQELAQRSCFNLPSYSCIREGPDHDPRFRATVNFNGEVFESPGYHTTIRQAEHSAAEIALNALSSRGPSHSLASRILDDTGVSKNLLQETAQRAGSSLPIYTTVRSGPKHLPLFKCVVEIGGKSFEGEPAKTKKQAEKNAAMAAWSSLKNLPPSKSETLSELTKFDNHRDSRSFDNRNRNDKSGFSSDRQLCRRSNTRNFNSRDKSYTLRDVNSGNRQTLSTVHPNVSHLSQNKSHGPYWMNNGACSGKDNKFVYDQQFAPVSRQLSVDIFSEASRGPSSSVRSSQRESRQNWRRHSMSGIEIPDVPCSGGAFVNQGSETGNVLGNVPMQSQESRARGLPYQSLSERFDLNRQLLLDELQQREEEGEWFHGDFVSRSTVGGNLHHTLNMHQQEARRRTLAYQSLSERFDPSRMLLLEELQQRDDGDECLYGDSLPAYNAVQNHGRRVPLHSLSERFEVKYHLPLLEEVPDRDEWDWLPNDDAMNTNHQTQNHSTLDSSQSLINNNNNYKEGWLRGEKLIQLLEDQKNNGFKKGWLQGEITKHNVDKKEPCTDEWLCKSQAENSFVCEKVSTTNDSCDEWEPISKSIEQELSKGHGYTEQKNEKKHVYHTSSSNSKSLSSLWSKSAHWWGSHIPTKTSSAAVAFASTLGLRPSRSATPVANMSCQIVSMSLGAHQETNTSNNGSSFHNRHSSIADEGSALKLLNKLRL